MKPMKRIKSIVKKIFVFSLVLIMFLLPITAWSADAKGNFANVILEETAEPIIDNTENNSTSTDKGEIDTGPTEISTETDGETLTTENQETASQTESSDFSMSNENNENEEEETPDTDIENNNQQDEIQENGEEDIYTLETTIQTTDGLSYTIKVSYSDDTNFPQNVTLSIEEITNFQLKQIYKAKTETIVKQPLEFVRFFDIKVLDENGTVLQPEAGLVEIRIEAVDLPSEQARVLHFGAEKTEELEVATEENAISFATDGFSVYAIVDTPFIPGNPGWYRVGTMNELNLLLDNGFYISQFNNYFITNSQFSISGSQNGLVKTAKLSDPTTQLEESDAALFYFEQVQDKYYIYTYDNNNVKKYLNSTGNSLSLVSLNEATEFTVEAFPGRSYGFRIYAPTDGVNWGLNMWGGTSGRGFACWNTITDNNCCLNLWYHIEDKADPYQLDGNAYGLVINQNNLTGIAMMAENNPDNTLVGKEVLIKNDTLNNEGMVYVSMNDSIDKWIFTYIDGHNYYIQSPEGQYLNLLADDTMSLTDRPSEYSVFTLESGTGSYIGKIRFTNKDGEAINLYGGKASRGFGGWNDRGSNEWLTLAKDSQLNDDDFVVYTATKISVSDTSKLHTGSKIAVYTRVWNETSKTYEFYAINHNGNLVRCYESGDLIQWIGTQIDTELWEFTEYFYEGTNTPNYYYELYNPYSGKYIAPQLVGEQVLSDSKIGINLNGRKYNDNYTNILAWDDPYYEYAGLKIENGKIVVCPMSQADDFYFALIQEEEESGLTTVDTIDNDNYGISMKMVDFNGPVETRRNLQQTNLLGYDTDGNGLVQPYLESNGYPLTNPDKTTKPQGSLYDLFSSATPANHLFLEAIYNESGYFEYDSTKNYAYLADGTNFTVYEQLGTVNSTNTSLDHGQFLPYNSLTNPATGEPWPYHPTRTNTTDTVDKPLPDWNPRKYERMHAIPVVAPYNTEGYPGANDEPPYTAVDYFFGMEISSAFAQSPDGVDAWGHDIIFEFSGDDDMWFFVDDMLVLDLGGVHAAVTGTVNFKTGRVTSSRGNTTIRDMFQASYVAQHPDATQAEINTFLDEYFEDGGTIFKNYSTHTMKVLYMERGAGASNLHMRFNMTAIKPGVVTLGKTISGTDKRDYSLAEFPYQIYYKTPNSNNYMLLEEDNTNIAVVYQGTNTPVKYASAYTPAGGSETYQSVFFLKPGQYAEIKVPDETDMYYIRECGINNDIYDVVQINGEVAQSTVNGNRSDYETTTASVESRPRVEYDNHVNQNALRNLFITKRLFAEDGVTPLTKTQDDTVFNFRVYVGTENDATPTLANMVDYHVLDEQGNYCKWSYQDQGFVSINKSNYAQLTDREKEQVTFVTSANGAISKIPAGYTVEMREMLIGTKFIVEERDYEIPVGYRMMDVGYVRVQGSYIIEEGDTPNSGTIRANSDPAIEVQNKRVWSISAHKVWSDEEYMESHGNIYVAVFNKNTMEMVSDTVREITSGTYDITYQFDTLLAGTTFSDYIVQEVELTGNYSVDANKKVTNYDSVTPIVTDGQLLVTGTSSAGEGSGLFSYVAGYNEGDLTGANNNIKTDTITNTRAGFKIQKTTEDDIPLANAIFTLTNSQNVEIGKSPYTSDENGLVTIAYLAEDTYTLTEISSPNGYQIMSEPITITKANGNITISGGDINGYVYDDTGDMPTLTVKDKPFDIQFQKIDEETLDPLEGVQYSLFRQVSSTSGPRKDYWPLAGFETIITDQNGKLNVNFEDLPHGIYYLVEKEPLAGYRMPLEDVCFQISNDGTVTLLSSEESSMTQTLVGGVTTYSITATNIAPVNDLVISKQVAGNSASLSKQFNFTIQFIQEEIEIPSSFNYEKDGVVYTESLINRKFSFTLGHNESVTVKDIPIGTRYIVVEDDYSSENYVTTSNNNRGIIAADVVQTVSFLNTKNSAIPTDLYDLTDILPWFGIPIIGGLIYFIWNKKRKNREKK